MLLICHRPLSIYSHSIANEHLLRSIINGLLVGTGSNPTKKPMFRKSCITRINAVFAQARQPLNVVESHGNRVMPPNPAGTRLFADTLRVASRRAPDRVQLRYQRVITSRDDKTPSTAIHHTVSQRLCGQYISHFAEAAPLRCNSLPLDGHRRFAGNSALKGPDTFSQSSLDTVNGSDRD